MRAARRARPGRAVDAAYVLARLPPPPEQMLYYGYIFVDGREYRLYHMGGQDRQNNGIGSLERSALQQMLPERAQCSQRATAADAQLQMRVEVAVLGGERAARYLTALPEQRRRQLALSHSGVQNMG